MMNDQEKLRRILSAYRSSHLSGAGTEFEIRFKDVTVDIFKQAYIKLQQKILPLVPTIATSINVISKNIHGRSSQESYIRTLMFVGGEKTRDIYSTKKSIHQPLMQTDFMRYTMNVNQETVTAPFSVNPQAVVRIKVRAEFQLTPDWRIDLTAVKESNMQALGKELPNIKKQMFPADISVDNFLERVQYDMIDRYELEAEWTGDALATENIQVVIDALRELLAGEQLKDSNYKSTLRTVSNLLHGRKGDIGLKQLLNQAISITKNTYAQTIYPPIGYYVTDKADGIRCCAYLHAGHTQLDLLADKLYTYTLNAAVPAVELPTVKELPTSIVKEAPVAVAEKLPAELPVKELPAELPIASALPAQASPIATGGFGLNAGSYVGLALLDKYMIPTFGIFAGGDPLPEEKPAVVCDCELLSDPTRILLFDCMYYGSILTGGYGERIQHLQQIAPIMNAFVPVESKKIKEIRDLSADIGEIYNSKHDYETDGLILTEPSKPYMSTKNYKWKPIENTTIDFMAVLCPHEWLGADPYVKVAGKDLYLLFVGVSHKMRLRLGLGLLPGYSKLFNVSGEYYPVQFSPSIDKYAYLYWHDPSLGNIDHKIVELRRQLAEHSWDFVRIRTDRLNEKNYYGNDFRIAEITYMNYVDVFEYRDLLEPSVGYFSRESSNIYLAGNKYRRFVISLLIKNNLQGAKNVIDEAAGKGADLHRYQEVSVSHLLCIDRDQSAIVELVRRKFDMFEVKRRRVQKWTDGGNQLPHVMTVHTMVRDMTAPVAGLTADTSKIFLPGTVDGIVCNFAIHYFCDDVQNIRNLLKYNAIMLKLGGVFMFTTMNGAKIFDALKSVDSGGQYEIEDGSTDPDYIYGSGSKYIIKKLYTGNKFANCGQKIAVRLPFADDLREEPLANIDFIIAECSKLGMELELNSSFSVWMDKFKHADGELYSKLTTGDKEYIDMHQFVTVRKIK